MKQALSLVPVLAYAALGLILHRTHGHHMGAYALELAAVALLLAIAPLRMSAPRPVIACLIVVFALRLLHDSDLEAMTAPSPALTWLLRALAGAAVVAAFFPRALVAVACLAVAAKLAVPLLSPAPHIDVWANSMAAADFFLGGKNPYAATYPDIYGAASKYPSTFSYWPGSLVALTLFRVVFGDIRFGLVACDVLFAWLISRRDKWLAVSWLVFPVTLFMTEQSWTDPLLLALFAAGMSRRRPGIALGLLAAAKQYALPAAGWGAWRHHRRRVAVTAAITFVVVMLPALVTDAHAFWNATIANLAGQSFRPDSLSLPAYFGHDFGLWALVPAFLVVLVRRDAAIFYFTLFLFARQAFCNYYVWVAGLLIARVMNPDDDTRKSEAVVTE